MGVIMLQNIEIRSFDGYSRRLSIMEADLCPNCHKGIRPDYISGYVESNFMISVFNYCTMCNLTFMSKYEYSKPINSWQSFIPTTFIESLPFNFSPRLFEDRINKLSPKFSKIYNQAKIAEEMNLDEIAGMGYRKSLEILIKDYSIFLKPGDKSKIIDSKFTLSKCISDYILDSQLNDLSRLTSWLGNDETHYSRVHIDKDINDLKDYLDATIFYINYDLTAKKAFVIVNQK